MKTLFCLVLAAMTFGLLTTSCGDTQPVEDTTTTDSTTTTITPPVQETPDFNKFFDIFKNNVVNKDYTAIDFPFHLFSILQTAHSLFCSFNRTGFKKTGLKFDLQYLSLLFI